MRRILVGNRIKEVEAVDDPIVFEKVPSSAVEAALKGRTAKKVGRKGKFWWIQWDDGSSLLGHLGMAGWIRHLGAHTTRLKEHGEAPLDDETGRPRFLKLMLVTEKGDRIAITDHRRLGRLWLGNVPEEDKRIKQLGPDAMEELPKGEKFAALYMKRNAPIKALLMDQGILSGLGNWLADEVLYHARIAPQRPASSLSATEFAKLRKAIVFVLSTAVDAGADEDKYPDDWLFHVRWGGSRGHGKLGKYDVIRETVVGRTSAWIPKLQK